MIAANRNHSCVNHGALLKDHELSRTRANICQAYAHFPLVIAQHRVGSRQRFEYGVIHMHACAIDSRNHVLGGTGRRRYHVDANFEASRHHA